MGPARSLFPVCLPRTRQRGYVINKKTCVPSSWPCGLLETRAARGGAEPDEDEGVTWPSVCDTHAGAGARRQQHFVEQVADGGVAALTSEHAEDHLERVDDHLQRGSVDGPLGARPWLRPGTPAPASAAWSSPPRCRRSPAAHAPSPTSWCA